MNQKIKHHLKFIDTVDDKVKQSIEAIIIVLIITDLFLIILMTFIDMPQSTRNLIIEFDLFVCIILFFEFMIKMRNEKSKLKYIRKNWVDMVAMVPVDFLAVITSDYIGLIRFIRIMRLARLARVFLLIRKGQKNILDFLRKTQLVHGAVIFLFIFAAGTVSFFLLEHGSNGSVDSFDDALWYVIVTITTVGYGDISPDSVGGRITGAIIMIAGVFFMSLLTASLASIMIEKETKEESDKTLEEMKSQMENMRQEMLTEINELKEIIKKSK